MPRAHKKSSDVTGSHLLRRTRHLENVGASISQGQMDVHVIHSFRLKEERDREAILHEALGKELVVELLEGQTLAMKADLSMSWHGLNKLRQLVGVGLTQQRQIYNSRYVYYLSYLFRWFKQWGIKMDTEKKNSEYRSLLSYRRRTFKRGCYHWNTLRRGATKW